MKGRIVRVIHIYFLRDRFGLLGLAIAFLF